MCKCCHTSARKCFCSLRASAVGCKDLLITIEVKGCCATQGWLSRFAWDLDGLHAASLDKLKLLGPSPHQVLNELQVEGVQVSGPATPGCQLRYRAGEGFTDRYCLLKG